MKMHEAMRIIRDVKPKGYMVSFERSDGRFLTSDYFPDKHAGEPLIETEEEAWELAQRFAANTTGRYVNVYVVDRNFAPVPNYKQKIIKNRL